MRQYADESGVWREDRPGEPYGIAWEEIHAVGGYVLDLSPYGLGRYTIVELDVSYGEWVELRGDGAGFAEVVHAITERLPGIPADWLASIEQADRAITVWHSGLTG